MRYLTVAELIAIHEMVIAQTGGSPGIRDHGTLQSAAAQPQMSWSGQDLYPSLEEKGAALCYSLVRNHPFVDGNKRISHAAMEIVLLLNGRSIVAEVDDSEQMMLRLAASEASREELVQWLRTRLTAE